MRVDALTLLLGALLLAGASAQSAPPADVLVTMPVTVDGSLRDLTLLRGESVEAAALSFVRSNGLASAQDAALTRQVVDQLSGLLKSRVQEMQAEDAAARAATAESSMPRVQLTLPLSIEGRATELRKYEGETAEAAVERFLYDSSLTLEAMRELYPRLVALVNSKLDELQPPRPQLFEFSLTIDGREATARHFEGGRPLDEAMDTLRAIGVQDGEFMDRVAPQIANEILNRMNAATRQQQQELQQQQQQQEMQQQQQQQEAQQQQQQQAKEEVAAPIETRAPPRRELFSLPLTLNGRAAVLVHYDGVTARETAMSFLSDNGVTDAAMIDELAPQLVELIDTRMSDLLQLEAQQAAEKQQQEQQQQQQQEQQPLEQQQRRTPLVSLPISLGGGRSTNLEYFDGDSVERTVEAFLAGVGLAQDANTAANTAQLSALVRERLAALEPQEPQEPQEPAPRESEQPRPTSTSTPAFSLPVTLGGRTFELEYVAGQEPAFVANAFCVEKHELLRAELGVDFDGDQLRECQRVLVGWIRDRVGRQQPVQEQQSPPPVAQQPPQPHGEDARGALLFALDIDMGDGSSRRLPFHRNDHPATLAARFCQQYSIDPENVPALVEAMQAQLAQL